MCVGLEEKKRIIDFIFNILFVIVGKIRVSFSPN